jgi:hypothetical protein
MERGGRKHVMNADNVKAKFLKGWINPNNVTPEWLAIWNEVYINAVKNGKILAVFELTADQVIELEKFLQQKVTHEIR